MEVTTTIEPEDIWHYYKIAVLPAYRRRQIVVLVVWLVVAEIIMAALHVRWQASAVGVVVALIFIVTREVSTTKRTLLKQVQSVPGLLGLTTTAFDPEGVRRRNPIGENSHPWTSYQSVRGDAHNIYFFLSKTQAQILPKRAFATPDEAERFLQTAQAYWNAAKNGMPPPAEVHDDKTWPPAPRTL